MNPLDELQGTLTVHEWDTVIKLVSQGPYNAVANIMSKLQSQLQGQTPTPPPSTDKGE